MESDKLYRVQKEDLPKVEKMLNQCFAHDPLYEMLIPDPEVRKNLMPELFKCDMDEFYATCEIFADSADLNSVLVVSDEAEPYNVFQFYFTCDHICQISGQFSHTFHVSTHMHEFGCLRCLQFCQYTC